MKVRRNSLYRVSLYLFCKSKIILRYEAYFKKFKTPVCLKKEKKKKEGEKNTLHGKRLSKQTIRVETMEKKLKDLTT